MYAEAGAGEGEEDFGKDLTLERPNQVQNIP